jgi:4-carboxymuconolactone decarboxylase
MSDEFFDRGHAIRKDVAGEEYVDKAWAAADDFTRPLQDLVTRFAWGGVWAREGLERKTRSLLNIAMLAALGRIEELKIHLRGAVRNGCSKVEIRETLLQVAPYAGFPAAIAGFRAAREVFAEGVEPKT